MRRNFGIDLLRIVSMICVILLHICSYGGVTDNISNFTSQWMQMWLIQACAYSAVNIYAIISGFVGIKSKHRYATLGMLWIQALTYSLVFSAVMFVIGEKLFSPAELVKSFFPVLTNRWWYLTKYVIVFLLAPAIDNAIRNTPIKTARNKLVVLGIVVIFSESARSAVFDTNAGYSVFWLSYLYAIGAYISFHDIHLKVKRRSAVLACFISMLSTWVFKIVADFMTYTIWGTPKLGTWLYSYTSPTVFIAAIAMVLIFAALNLKHTKVISLFSSVTFGVFLIHTHRFFLSGISKGVIGDIAAMNPLMVIPRLLFGAVFVFLICSLVELVRIRVMYLLRIREKLTKAEEAFVNKLS